MALSALSIPASGFKAAQLRLRTSAHNTANINTNGFNRQTVMHEELPTGGVRSTVRIIETPGDPRVDIQTGEQIETSNLGLIDEAVNRITSLAAARSNGSVIRSQDDMLGVVVNILT